MNESPVTNGHICNSDELRDPVTAKTWTYAKDPEWRPSMGGLVDPLAALQALVGLCEEHPLFNDPDAAPEIYAAMFHAKEAAIAWRQVAEPK